MDAKLSDDELRWLAELDTEAPVKPEVPAPVAEGLVGQGLAIRLVEGGLQLTSLGRERLSHSKSPG
jgi:hypothetical protein